MRRICVESALGTSDFFLLLPRDLVSGLGVGALWVVVWSPIELKAVLREMNKPH